ncbi:MAG: aquaporin [Rhodomicrobium sp.]
MARSALARVWPCGAADKTTPPKFAHQFPTGRIGALPIVVVAPRSSWRQSSAQELLAERLAGGNGAIALLGNTLPTGAILIVLITVFGETSGAHFNPAVTLAFLMRREIAANIAFAYIAAQILGALIGMLSAHIMFDVSLFQISEKVRTGTAQWFSEGVATFGLLLAIFGTLRNRPQAVPFIRVRCGWRNGTNFIAPDGEGSARRG